MTPLLVVEETIFPAMHLAAIFFCHSACFGSLNKYCMSAAAFLPTCLSALRSALILCFVILKQKGFVRKVFCKRVWFGRKYSARECGSEESILQESVVRSLEYLLVLVFVVANGKLMRKVMSQMEN